MLDQEADSNRIDTAAMMLDLRDQLPFLMVGKIIKAIMHSCIALCSRFSRHDKPKVGASSTGQKVNPTRDMAQVPATAIHQKNPPEKKRKKICIQKQLTEGVRLMQSLTISTRRASPLYNPCLLRSSSYKQPAVMQQAGAGKEALTQHAYDS